MNMDRFAAIRDVLSKGPSETNWRELLKHLRAWPQKEQREMAIQYIDAHLATWPDHLRSLSELADSPYWRFIRCYELRTNIKKRTLKAKLEESPYLPQLTAFKWETGGPINDVLMTLLASENCSKLKDIRLKRCQLENLHYPGSHYSTFHGHCSLEHFRWEEAGDDVNPWAAMLKLPSFDKLKTLSLSNALDPSMHFSDFQNSAFRATLEELSLENCLRNDFLETLPEFPTLKRLSLARNQWIRKEDWARFADWPTLEQLSFFDLSGTYIGIEELSELLKSPYFHDNLLINLRGTSITKEKVDELLPELEGLSIPMLRLDG